MTLFHWILLLNEQMVTEVDGRAQGTAHLVRNVLTVNCGHDLLVLDVLKLFEVTNIVKIN